MPSPRRHAVSWTVVLTIVGAVGLSLAPLPDAWRPWPGLAERPRETLIKTLWPSAAVKPKRLPQHTAVQDGTEPGTTLPSEDAVPVEDQVPVVPVAPVPLALPEVPREKYVPRLSPEEEQRGRRLEVLARTVGARSPDVDDPCLERQPTEHCNRTALTPFFEALEQMHQGRIQGPVRVLALGTSLIVSDHITDVMRARLQSRHGSAGRGFMFVDRPMRGVGRTVRSGTATEGWDIQHATDDPVPPRMGMSGVSFQSKPGARETTAFDTDGSSHVELFLVKQPGGGDVEVYGDKSLLDRVPTNDSQWGSDFAWVDLPKGKKRVVIQSTGGPVRLDGVVLESPVPGVVFDTLGLPGATPTVLLKEDLDLFSAQLSHRDPHLVVLILGGNDAFDIAVGRYPPPEAKSRFQSFLERLKATVPGAACLLAAPPDAGVWRMDKTIAVRAETKHVTAYMHELANAYGCAFWDMQAAMGGEGAVNRWWDAGLMNEDLVHPTVQGADLMGYLFDEAVERARLRNEVLLAHRQPRRAPVRRIEAPTHLPSRRARGEGQGEGSAPSRHRGARRNRGHRLEHLTRDLLLAQAGPHPHRGPRDVADAGSAPAGARGAHATAGPPAVDAGSASAAAPGPHAAGSPASAVDAGAHGARGAAGPPASAADAGPAPAGARGAHATTPPANAVEVGPGSTGARGAHAAAGAPDAGAASSGARGAHAVAGAPDAGAASTGARGAHAMAGPPGAGDTGAPATGARGTHAAAGPPVGAVDAGAPRAGPPASAVDAGARGVAASASDAGAALTGTRGPGPTVAPPPRAADAGAPPAADAGAARGSPDASAGLRVDAGAPRARDEADAGRRPDAGTPDAGRSGHAGDTAVRVEGDAGEEHPELEHGLLCVNVGDGGEELVCHYYEGDLPADLDDSLDGGPRPQVVGARHVYADGGTSLCYAGTPPPDTNPASTTPPCLQNPQALEPFFQWLLELERTRRGRVAIAQLGASHTAAQFFTDTVREALATRFGSAGRGYVAAGKASPRLVSSGAWRSVEPGWQVLDAVHNKAPHEAWGLSGARAVGRPGAGLVVGFDEKHGNGDDVARMQISLLEGPDAGAVEISIDGKEVARTAPGASSRVKVVEVAAPGRRHEVELTALGPGPTTVFGVTHERMAPGIVYDSLGLPGATSMTVAGYSQEALVEQLRAREVDLFVLFFGTNEASLPRARIDGEMRAAYATLFKTLNEASPQAACLIIAPTDRQSRRKGAWHAPESMDLVSNQMEAIARDHGCAFWATRLVMGGPGSIDRWRRANPTLANKDHVHLSALGYRHLADMFAFDLLSAYDAWRAGR